MKLVMGFGTFDGLHPGHLFYLEEIKKLGDKLIVVIARDRNVERFKGKSPKFSELERLEGVKQANIADEVVLGNENDLYEVIRKYKPHILGLGYDQKANAEKVNQLFPEIEIKRVGAYFPEKYKSSLLN